MFEMLNNVYKVALMVIVFFQLLQQLGSLGSTPSLSFHFLLQFQGVGWLNSWHLGSLQHDVVVQERAAHMPGVGGR